MNFPRVSSDVIQVSPLLEKIAYRLRPYPEFNGLQGEAMDLLIGRSGESEEGKVPGEPVREGALSLHGLYFLDQQPVMSGARYRYFVMRFKQNRELDQIIPAGEVTIP